LLLLLLLQLLRLCPLSSSLNCYVCNCVIYITGGFCWTVMYVTLLYILHYSLPAVVVVVVVVVSLSSWLNCYGCNYVICITGQFHWNPFVCNCVINITAQPALTFLILNVYANIDILTRVTLWHFQEEVRVIPHSSGNMFLCYMYNNVT
jgi:hypothetical protein